VHSDIFRFIPVDRSFFRVSIVGAHFGISLELFIRLRQNTLSLATGMNAGGAPANFAEIPCCLQQGASFPEMWSP